MKSFEYIVMRKRITEGILKKPISPEKELNNLGEKGWELVNVTPDNERKEMIFFFKREV